MATVVVLMRVWTMELKDLGPEDHAGGSPAPLLPGGHESAALYGTTQWEEHLEARP